MDFNLNAAAVRKIIIFGDNNDDAQPKLHDHPMDVYT